MKTPIATALLVLLPLGLSFAEEAADVSTLDTPRAGWRDSGDERRSYVQPVHYPASSVNTERAAEASLISGHIAAAHKGPATLVVNGVALPLQVGESGAFSRPYAFAKGSNSVEVRAEGMAPLRRQFYDAYSGKAPVKLRVLLSWDSDGTDVDLHVIDPTGAHTFYADRVSPSGGALDVDVTTGYGPEIFSHPSPPPGVYHVYVNFFGAGREREIVTVAHVTVLIGEGTLREKRQELMVPLRSPGDLMLAYSFVYP
jgi:uncharacterized protein YfaP (DUF2135 family)